MLKKIRKSAAALILLFFTFFTSAFAQANAGLNNIDIQGSITKVNSGFNSFAREVRKTIPNTIAGQNVYADSYVGDFLPAGRHFAAGLNFSIARLDSSQLSSVFETMSALFKVIGHDISMDVPSVLPLPSVTLDARIGGFWIPVDFGFTFTAISGDAFSINPSDPSTFTEVSSPIKLSRGDFDGNFTLFSIGFDARYAILRNKKHAPDISAGLGWYLSKGALSMHVKDVNENGTLEVNMAHSFFTQVIMIQSQISKNFGVLTPFGGCKLLWAASENGWVRKVYLDGIYMPMSGSNCIKQGFNLSLIEPQLFAGTGINIGYVQITISAAFDARNINASGALSVRFKK